MAAVAKGRDAVNEVTMLTGRRCSVVEARRAVAAACLVVAFAAICRGQAETGQITGTVKDATGAVVASATVKTTSVATGAERSTSVGESGTYTIANLLPGRYAVAVVAPGFIAETREVDVRVGGRSTLDFDLVVGGAIGTAEVVEAAEGVRPNTETPELSTVVTNKQVAELPTVDRDPIALVGISGNVNEQLESGADVAINGQRASSTNVLLDGADNNDEFAAEPAQSVPLDSVEEFSVVTSAFSAEFGRASGGIINIATKSGTNEFHGTVYEFNRVSALGSARFEGNAQVVSGEPDSGGIKKPVSTRNQFGFSLGGPVVRDKLVFFMNLEWLHVRTHTPVSFLVPTPELLAASAPATQAFFAAYQLKTPINGRIVRVADIPGLGSGPFRSLGPTFPAFGQVIVPIANDQLGVGDPGDQFQLVGRGDWNLSDKTTAYARVALERGTVSPGKTSQSPYAGFDTGELVSNTNVLGSVTHVVSEHLVVQAKLVVNRLSRTEPLGDARVGPTLFAFEDRVARFAGLPVAFPGYQPFGPDSPLPFGGPQNLLQGYVDANVGLGNHQVRVGGSYVHDADDRMFGAFENAAEVLGATRTKALDNLVLGRILQFKRAIDPQGHFPFERIDLPISPPDFARRNWFNEFAVYVSDTWRARPRVVLSLGLRYEYFGVQHNEDPRLDSNFYPGDGATVFERIRTGRVLRARESPIGSLYRPDRNNVAPRVGIAWDVFGNLKTSVRGGYGVGYERPSGEATFDVIRNPPAYGVVNVLAPDVGLPFLPIYGDNSGPLAGSGTVVLPRTSVEAIDPNLQTAYAHTWSASLEHQLFGNTLVSLQYSGSKGVRLYSLENVNRPFSGAVYLGLPFKGQPGYDPSNPTLTLNRQYDDINRRSNGGFSNYNGLTLGVETRDPDRTGLILTARYTWSHTIDNLSSALSISENNLNLGLLDPFDPRLDKGDADFDVRHRFVTSGVWSVPPCPEGGRCKRRFVEGWTMSYIFTARTGQPFTIYDCTNAAQACPRMLLVSPVDANGSSNPPPSQLPGELATGNRYVYIDLASQLPGAGGYASPVASAAATAASGEPTLVSDFGPFPSNMSGRNGFRGPGAWTLDATVSRKLMLGDKVSLQLRAEAYNLFNHPTLFVAGGEAEVATGYVPAFYAGRRQVQLAIRLSF